MARRSLSEQQCKLHHDLAIQLLGTRAYWVSQNDRGVPAQDAVEAAQCSEGGPFVLVVGQVEYILSQVSWLMVDPGGKVHAYSKVGAAITSHQIFPAGRLILTLYPGPSGLAAREQIIRQLEGADALPSRP